MTKREVERTFARLVKLMRLGHWRIKLDLDSPAGEGNNADVWRSYQYDDASIRLAANWRQRSSREIAYLLAHELGHILLRDLDQAALSVEDDLGEEGFVHYERRYKHEAEGVVDRYAEMLADFVL